MGDRSGGYPMKEKKRSNFAQKFRTFVGLSPKQHSPPEDPSQSDRLAELPTNPSEPSYPVTHEHNHTRMSAGPPMNTAGYRQYPPQYTMPPKLSPGTEIIIALMGITGAGKSYFIREVTGNSEVEVSDGLYSCTRKVQSYSFEYAEAKITLVDTPGFDDTNRSDTEVLQEIAEWTSATYKEGQLLSGIIYLHPITHTRVEGSAMRNLRMFQSLCGQEALENVFLTTTQWSHVNPVEAELREARLRHQGFWGPLIDKGATPQRFHGTRESGFELIHRLMSNTRKPLDIQDQIVKQHLTLLETSAGKFINEELIAQERKFKERIESLEQELRGAMEAVGDEMRAIRKEQAEEREEREKKQAEERKEREKKHAEEREEREKKHAEEREELEKQQAEVQKKLEKAEAGIKLLAELHAAEVKKREAREREEEARRSDRTVIAVATRDIAITAHIAGVFTSYKTRGRLILDIDNHEEFEADTIEITINYQLSFLSGIRVYTKTFREVFDAGIGDTNYIVLDGVHYRCKSGAPIRVGGQEFVIFSKG